MFFKLKRKIKNINLTQKHFAQVLGILFITIVALIGAHYLYHSHAAGNPPTVAITSPSAGTSDSGNALNINSTATANDGGSISNVQLLVDNNSVQTLSTSPFNFVLNTINYSDGSHTITVQATDDQGNVNSSSVTVILTNGDLNSDNSVNISDLAIMAGNWNKTGMTYAQGDINGDGKVNILDFAILAKNWGWTNSVSSCPSGQLGTPPNCVPAPPIAAASGKQWQVSYDDEFNESTLDTTKLTPCFDWNTGGCTSSFNNGYEHYQPSQVQLSNGIANLVAAPLSPAVSDSACFNGSCTYKSGLIATSRPLANNGSGYLYTFTYGYVVASIKPLNTQGFFAAFWMLPADTSYSYNYEIDILEQLGIPHPSDMEMHYSYNNRGTSYTPNGGGSTPGINNNNGACASNIDYSQAFHTYGVDWEPTYVAFYIDGVKCGEFNGTAGGTIENQPMQIILDQMVSNDWQRAAGVPLTNTSLTSDLQVDYLRVYQQK